VTYRLGLDDFRIGRLELGLKLGERELGLATLGLYYMSESRNIVNTNTTVIVNYWNGFLI